MPQAVLLTLSLFNSRSPHGERFPFLGIPASKDISILAPAWGATYFQFTAHYCHHISILAPCLGSDKSVMLHRRSFAVFNSCSPHGERSRLLSLFRTALFFQFSLPA